MDIRKRKEKAKATARIETTAEILEAALALSDQSLETSSSRPHSLFAELNSSSVPAASSRSPNPTLLSYTDESQQQSTQGSGLTSSNPDYLATQTPTWYQQGTISHPSDFITPSPGQFQPGFSPEYSRISSRSYYSESPVSPASYGMFSPRSSMERDMVTKHYFLPYCASIAQSTCLFFI